MRLALIFAIVLMLVHFLIERTVHKYRGVEEKITSLSLGVFITFIFLDLMPRLYEADTGIGQNIFFFMNNTVNSPGLLNQPSEHQHIQSI